MGSRSRSSPRRDPWRTCSSSRRRRAAWTWPSSRGARGRPTRRASSRSASVFFEPLWVFVRDAVPARYVGDLAGRRLAVGVEGSGARVLALQLLQASGVAEGPNLLAMGGDEAVQALLKGTVDAAFFVTARPQPQLDPLLRAKRVRLMSFAQADAFAQRFRFLSKLILPEGRLDLAADVPPADVTLLAPAAALVAREDLHPAIIDRLIQAATEVHGGGQLFTEPGQFPSPRFVDIPISPDAERYLRLGPTFLRRHLPFWAAAMVERFMVMLIPIVTLLLPLLRFAPARVQMAGAPADLPLVRNAAGHRGAGPGGSRAGRACGAYANSTGSTRKSERCRFLSGTRKATTTYGCTSSSSDARSRRRRGPGGGGVGRLAPNRRRAPRQLAMPRWRQPCPLPSGADVPRRRLRCHGRCRSLRSRQ